jgi:hypothetical protein
MNGYGLVLEYRDGTVGYIGKTEITTSPSMCWIAQSETEFNIILVHATNHRDMISDKPRIKLFGPIKDIKE